MSKPGKATLNHGLVPVDLKSAKEPLPHQTVMKIFSISIIAQGLPFCRRRQCFFQPKSCRMRQFDNFEYIRDITSSDFLSQVLIH